MGGKVKRIKPLKTLLRSDATAQVRQLQQLCDLTPSILSRMRRRTTGLLIAALMASEMTMAVSAVPSLKIAGLTRQDFTVEQGTQVVGLVIHARNVVAGLPTQTADPLPCKPGTLLFGSVPKNKGYGGVRDSMTGQGWQLTKAVAGRGGQETAFQTRKGGVTALGLWTTLPTRQDAVLVMCEQAAVWKPEPAVQGPSKSAPLGAALKLTVKEWKGGVQPLRAVLVTGASGASGTISARGQVQLPLTAPLAAQMLPMNRWRQAFNILNCGDGGSFKGAIKLSDPAVKFTAISKMTTELDSPTGRTFLKAGGINPAVTKILETPLIYTSAPVRLSGNLTCGDGDRNLTVDLTLPGGWTAVSFEADLPDSGKATQRVMNFAGQWGWESAEP